ncbi:Ankyrin repeat domain-containing protein 29 [Tetrabaena socialis]|uniref:Ankyrin repeat domain-containing protein 29 n=1 Tax=Tetrabaena socialis TaxID=47790 RepID=A0A2J7ZUZ8_9CHLO|nr:Ankyrin repeat domain-containing protein 29 [Tetrabaena socialis]|eukprot:PNH04094.1 Ankyrin repeat domain-containing protein 29 [Tetrabaena socialis]
MAQPVPPLQAPLPAVPPADAPVPTPPTAGDVGDASDPSSRSSSSGNDTSATSAAEQVFLSYRVRDTGNEEGDGTMERIKVYLEGMGYSVFSDVELRGGQVFAVRIQAAIERSQVFIALCSKGYGDSDWTRMEFELARKLKKHILPLWHDSEYPPRALQIYLSSLNRIPKGSKPLLECGFIKAMQELVVRLEEVGCLPLPGAAKDLILREAETRDEWALLVAAQDGDLSEVTRLLAKPAINPNVQDEYDEQYADDKRALASAGYDDSDDGYTKDGRTALHHASEGGHTAVVEVLVRAGADVNSKIRGLGMTALHVASNTSNTEGAVEVVKVLLKAGADVNAAAPDGKTALYYASTWGHVELIEALLKAGADVDAATRDGETALHYASARGHVESVEALLKAGADMRIVLQVRQQLRQRL